MQVSKKKKRSATTKQQIIIHSYDLPTDCQKSFDLHLQHEGDYDMHSRYRDCKWNKFPFTVNCAL